MQIQGTVIHGKKEARDLGYPTANVEYRAAERAEEGVWTCWLTLDGKKIPSVAIVGMWELKGGEPSVEIHALETIGDIYGKEVEVTFGEHLRNLMLFETMDALALQIKKDLEQAQAWFTAR